MGPSLGEGHVCKGGQFGMLESMILSPQDLFLSSFRAWFVVSGDDKFTPCLMQIRGLSLHTQKLTDFSLQACKPGLSKASRHL